MQCHGLTFHLTFGLDIVTSIGIGAPSFNIYRSSHKTADIDKYYQYFNIEITYTKQTKF